MYNIENVLGQTLFEFDNSTMNETEGGNETAGAGNETAGGNETASGNET